MIVPFLLLSLYSANRFAEVKGSMKIATIVHFTSWAFQILGHQVFEKRSPAFVKDPVQALVLGIEATDFSTTFCFL